MDWPPHSPDYNITEAVWDQTENRKKQLPTKEQL